MSVSRLAQWIVFFFVVVGGVVFINALWPVEKDRVSLKAPEASEPSVPLQGTSPAVESFEREQKRLSFRQEEVKKYLEKSAEQAAEKNTPLTKEDKIRVKIRELMTCKAENCAVETSQALEREMKALAQLQTYQDLQATEEWTEVLLEVAQNYPELDQRAMDIARDFEGPEVLRRFYSLPKLSAMSKAHLIEASLYRSELASPDPGLIESAGEMLRSMLQKGSAAEALSALSLVNQVPGLDEDQLVQIERSLCRFQSQGDLEFTLIRSKWGRVAKRSLDAEATGPCRGT